MTPRSAKIGQSGIGALSGDASRTSTRTCWPNLPIEPLWVPLSAAIEFNRLIAQRFGGRHELRNIAALKLALASPWNLWVYSKVNDPAALAAALFADMTRVNAFADGNRRTAFLCAVAFIEAQGCVFSMPDSVVSAEQLRDFAEGRRGEKALAEWLRDWIGPADHG
jgi:death-on-curing protein